MNSSQPTGTLHRLLSSVSVLSLDSPIVAVSWQVLIAKTTATTLSLAHHAILFLVTWLAYTADRWLDSRRFRTEKISTARHAFSNRFATSLLWAWLLLFLLLVVLALTTLSVNELVSGALLALVVAVYFVAVQTAPHIFRVWIPREIVVAAFFMIATGFFTWHHVGENTVILWQCLAWYFLIGLLNCVGISIWEREADVLVLESTLATRFPKLADLYPTSAFAMMVAAGMQLFLTGNSHHPILVAVMLIAIGLVSIHWFVRDRRIQPPLADFAVAIPALVCSFF